jgi:hypothetical protein
MLGFHRLGRAVRTGAGQQVVVPDVPAGPHGAGATGRTDDDDRLHRGQVVDGVVDGGLDRAVLPLRRAPSAVISARADDTSSRSRTADGANPPNITVCGAPIRAQASMATTTSGIIGR